MVKRLARSAGGGGLGEENGDCAADPGCDWGPGRWRADKRDCRLGPSRELIKFAMFGGLDSAGMPGWGMGGWGMGMGCI